MAISFQALLLCRYQLHPDFTAQFAPRPVHKHSEMSHVLPGLLWLSFCVIIVVTANTTHNALVAEFMDKQFVLCNWRWCMLTGDAFAAIIVDGIANGQY